MLLSLEADAMDLENVPDYTCEFWINNCEFEVFFDLSRQSSYRSETPELEEKEPSEKSINDLPTEMLSHIFGFCQAVDLLAVESVCQRWKEIVQFDKALWNHLVFSAADLDVKTAASFLKEMPLLRSVRVGNVHSREEMSFLITVLCDACWQLQQLHFPENCDWHPSAHDLFKLSYYHPCVTALQLCTKQKISPAELAGLGAELAGFSYLKHLTLVGFYWYQSDLFPQLLSQIGPLTSLSLPSVPGLSGSDLAELKEVQPDITDLTLNTSAMQAKHFVYLRHFSKLSNLKIVDSSAVTREKLEALQPLGCLTSLDIDLSNSKKEDVVAFFTHPRDRLVQLTVSNCRFSDEVLAILPNSCSSLQEVHWLNPRDCAGEMTDGGMAAVCRLPKLAALDVRSRSVTNASHPLLAAVRSLKCVRINGMKVPGCL